MTIRQAYYRHRKFNRKYWYGRLSRPKIRVIPSGQDGTLLRRCHDWGACEKTAEGFVIELRATAEDVDRTFGSSVLLHEMIHQALYPDLSHGDDFKDEGRRIGALGAMEEVI